MRLSTAAELAVRGILVLAEHDGEGPVTLQHICRQRGLPKQYLVKLFSMLAKADLVTAVRGKHGGYMLSRALGEITILDVIEAIEGPLAMNFCQFDPPKCDRLDCPLRPVWAQIQQMVRSRLGGVTLRDCVRPAGRRAAEGAALGPSAKSAATARPARPVSGARAS
ncbi:MAG: Rrf2 family transcriptional regulator [Planctomycetes bacterium]|nr:Rrf2 family transcriptional regulator [Planctomycetota bacterium]